MYKPKSPLAPSKINNFSPSPSNRRKNANVKPKQVENFTAHRKTNSYLHDAKM